MGFKVLREEREWGRSGDEVRDMSCFVPAPRQFDFAIEITAYMRHVMSLQLHCCMHCEGDAAYAYKCTISSLFAAFVLACMMKCCSAAMLLLGIALRRDCLAAW